MTNGNELRYHLVAIIDVLGQRSLLRDLKSLPTNAEETERVGRILVETAGFVRTIRSAFAAYLKRFQAPTEVITAIPEKDRARFLELRPSEIVVRGISDAIVISVSIRGDNSYSNSAVGISGALTGICAMCVTALAAGKLLRGGVDIGLGVEVAEGEVYGAALERAYELEAHVACTPRIVIGSECMRFMEALENLPNDDAAARVAKRTNRLSKSLISQDGDGQPILDFVGGAYRNQIARATENIKPLLEKGYSLVREEEIGRRTDPDPRVHEKYLALRRYLESRLPIWEVAVNPEP